jgi:signal transduction histidine kinase
MSIRRTLYGKLAGVLLVLFGAIGLSYLVLGQYATQRHYLEVNQKLNQNLAKNLLKESLVMRDGRIDESALEEIFHIMMVINPQIELYLLDDAGRVLSFSAPEGSVVRDRVSLEPILEFLSPEPQLPLLGDDPRDVHGRKVFSVAPVTEENDGARDGYLYVILAGEEYDSVAQMLEGSHVLRLTSGLMIASLAFVLFSGLLLFRLSTRRLRQLSSALAEYRGSGFRAAPPGQEPADPRDEIDEIGATFREMASRITSQIEELKEKDRLRRELVANVSHDLRTPLASLQGYLETLLLKRGELPPERELEYLKTASRHSERLGKLVAELFELAKLDASEMELSRELFSLAELVQDVVQEFALVANEKGVLLRTDFSDEGGRVDADIRLIERVLSNLVENALRFTESGGRVDVRVSSDNGAFVAEVRDTGCGIPAEELPFIFDRFYRAKKTIDTTGKTTASSASVGFAASSGSGLGLAIAKRILELHDTSIEAESEPGEGTVFRFRLPAGDRPPA